MFHNHHSSVESLSVILTFSIEDYSEFFDGGQPLSELVHDARLLITTHRAALDAASDKYSLHNLLLGMMEHAIHADGKRYVAVAVRTAAKDGADGLTRVAQAWMHHLFFPIMTLFRDEKAGPSRSQTPTLPHTTSLIESTLGEQVALRERHRCAITGFLDARIAHGLTDEARANILAKGPVHLSTMAAAYIIPFCFNNFKEAVPKDLRDSARTWDMLKAWAGIDFEELVSDKIMKPDNAIFMTSSEHILFGKFAFYLDKDAYPDDPHKYKLRMTRDNVYLSNWEREADVQFATDSAISPPDPTFICIHAAFAKVLSLCGAVEYIAKLERDTDRQMALGVHTENDFAALLKSKLDFLAF